MRTVMLSITLLIITSGYALAEKDQAQIIKENCAEKWGTDYTMQEYCQKSQYEAVQEIQGLINKYPKDSEEQKIINRCGNKWRWGEGWDFTMVVYCSKQQIEAYNKVK